MHASCLPRLPAVYAAFLSTVYNTLPPLDEATRLLWAVVIHVMLGRVLYDASLLLADPICTFWRQRVANAPGAAAERKNRQRLQEARVVQVLHVLSLQYLVTSATAILTLSAQSLCVCVFALLDQLGGLHSWYMFNQRVEHSRATPLLAKGSKYRNDAGECWHAIKPLSPLETEAEGTDEATPVSNPRPRAKSPISERPAERARPAKSPPPASRRARG